MDTQPLTASFSKQEIRSELDAFVFTALDQTLSDLGSMSKSAILAQLATENIEYKAEKVDLRLVYNRIRTLLGDNAAELVMAMMYDKLCKTSRINQDTVPMEDSYSRIGKLVQMLQVCR